MERMQRRGRARRVGGLAALVVLVAGVVVALPPTEPAHAATLPAGFTSTPVMTGLTLPTAMAFSPDGKVYVAQKNGVVKVYPSASSNSGTTFVNLGSRVYNNYDRGLLGLTVDPRLGDGSNHDFVYVLYAKDAPPGQTPPVWRDDCPSPPGPHTDGCVVSGTLSRIPVNANGTAGAEQVIIDNQWCQQYTSHSVGHLAFGPDGYLYVSGGEGASYSNADWGQFGGTLSGTPTPANPCGDPPGGTGVANSAPTARGGSMRSQSVRRPAGEPRLLSGALLRLNPDTGAGVPGNPLYDAAAPSANASRIVAYGMRNPYRFAMRPGTSEIWAGDVGAGDWEEIDRITSPTPTKAVNFGWPCYENTTHLGGFEDLDLCRSLYTDTTSPATSPYFAYKHFVAMNGNDTCNVNDGASISGIAFYSGDRYPAQYKNALFFGDYTRNCLWVMRAGANGLPDPSTVTTFIDDADAPFPADLEVDPVSQDIFSVNIAAGTVSRISYASSNRAPVAGATASPLSGTAPLSVHLDATSSTDPDGDALTYSWDTDGNGSFGDATGATPTVSYPSGGTFPARVLVTDTGGLSDTSDAVTISVASPTGPANTVPPAVSGTTTVGATLSSTTGTWTGTAPVTYARRWQRCTSTTSCADISGATGANYTAQLADAGSSLRIRVTATNAGGSAAAVSDLVGPVASAPNSAPQPVIDSPVATTNWKAGDLITYAGHATDVEDGTEPASQLTWSIVLGHCTTLGCHQHPIATIPGKSGGSFSAPDHEAPSYLELTLTATDAVGQSASVTRRIDPLTATLTFATAPGGLHLTVGAAASTATPFTQTWVANSQVQVIAPPVQQSGATSYAFSKWSDGGVATHILNAPASDTTFTATYTKATPAYVLDAYGGLHAVGGAPDATGAPYWPGWDIARGVTRAPAGGGFVLDGFGGLHRFATGGVKPAAATGGPYWSGWNIARGVALLPNGSGGYVLDGFGGLHPIAVGGGAPPAAARVSGYWTNWDIARGVAMNRDGKGGYVLDAYGGLHPFAVGSNPMPATPTSGPYWSGRDVARGIGSAVDGGGGYVLDGAGTVYRYHAPTRPPTFPATPTWPGWDIVRGLAT